MRHTLLISIAVLVMLSPAAARENKTQEQKAATPAIEKPKNEVERMLEGAAKRGEKVLVGCITEDCAGSDQKIESGVVIGKALHLAKPAYPNIARKAYAQGEVKVQVIIDEEGYVAAAVAISGHPLLYGVSAAAARETTFTPTLLQGKPVKVVGVLTYNFVAR